MMEVLSKNVYFVYNIMKYSKNKTNPYRAITQSVSSSFQCHLILSLSALCRLIRLGPHFHDVGSCELTPTKSQ